MCDRPKQTFNCKKPLILLKKKANQFENETTEKIITLPKYIPTFYGDRFIPRRFSLKNCERNLKFATEKPPKDVLSLVTAKRITACSGISKEFIRSPYKRTITDLCPNKDYWREDSYLPTFNYIMEMEHKRILDFMDPVVKSTVFVEKTHLHSFREKNWFLYDWPCRPRSKPSASINSTFDLPEHDASFDQNLVDWSARGHIAFSFGHDIIIWKSMDDVTLAFNTECTRSLAYSPNGNFLAIGCKSSGYPVLQLWDVSSFDGFSLISLKLFSLKHAAVRCIQWTASGKQIVCGTHYGCIYVISVPDLDTIKEIRGHKLPITHIRISPTTRYFASGDAEGNIVIYNWKMCNVYLHVRSRRKLNVVFDWHPWTGVDLAISEDIPASIVILNVPSKQIVAYYQQNMSEIVINYISFSKITGELLVSISNKDGSLCRDYKILVMSSLDRVVDTLKIPDGDARFLMWSPDGTTVATTNNDTDLSLWQFYSMKKTRDLKKVSASRNLLPSESKFGNEFLKWSFIR